MLSEEAFVTKLERSRGILFREERSIQVLLSSAALINPSATSVRSWPCLVLMPQILALHSALLTSLQSIKSSDSSENERACLAAKIFLDHSSFLMSLHATYALHYEATDHSNALKSILASPMEHFPLYLTILDAFEPFAPSRDRWTTIRGEFAANIEKERAKQTEYKRRLELENALGMDLLGRTLLMEDHLTISTGNYSGVNSRTLLFHDLVLVLLDESPSRILFQASVLQTWLFSIPESSTALLLTPIGSCYLHRLPSIAWLSHLRSLFPCHTTPLHFDAHAVLASNDLFPVDWLVSESALMAPSLQSDIVWLWNPEHSMPRLRQLYLIRDMLIYGDIHSANSCTFSGYILGEDIAVKTINGNVIELIVSAASDSMAEPQTWMLCPQTEARRQEWIAILTQLTTTEALAYGNNSPMNSSITATSPDKICGEESTVPREKAHETRKRRQTSAHVDDTSDVKEIRHRLDQESHRTNNIILMDKIAEQGLSTEQRVTGVAEVNEKCQHAKPEKRKSKIDIVKRSKRARSTMSLSSSSELSTEECKENDVLPVLRNECVVDKLEGTSVVLRIVLTGFDDPEPFLIKVHDGIDTSPVCIILLF